jgi:predicted alpha/beta-hydrolase family hydrolase
VATLDTPYGPARLSSLGPATHGTALLMHGAGSSSDVPFLVTLAGALADLGWRAVRLDHPYIVAGRRAPPPAKAVDAVVDLAMAATAPVLLVGRSMSARAACRAAARHPEVRQVVAQGFPLVPPGRPGVTRADELAACPVPVLVVQGERDTFGSPADVAALGLAHVVVHAVAGADHALRPRLKDGRTEAECVAEAVTSVTRACC